MLMASKSNQILGIYGSTVAAFAIMMTDLLISHDKARILLFLGGLILSHCMIQLTSRISFCDLTSYFASGARCHFAQHDKTMLIGADPSHVGDRCIRVTIHHCFFDGTRQRHPRLRFGKVHLYNNYTRNWGIYAVCASVESQVIGAWALNHMEHYYMDSSSIPPVSNRYSKGQVMDVSDTHNQIHVDTYPSIRRL